LPMPVQLLEWSVARSVEAWPDSAIATLCGDHNEYPLCLPTNLDYTYVHNTNFALNKCEFNFKAN
jgi:hypothetical protein